MLTIRLRYELSHENQTLQSHAQGVLIARRTQQLSCLKQPLDCRKHIAQVVQYDGITSRKTNLIRQTYHLIKSLV